MTVASMQVLQALLRAKEKADPKAWAHQQQQLQTAKLQRTRLQRECDDLQVAIATAEAEERHRLAGGS